MGVEEIAAEDRSGIFVTGAIVDVETTGFSPEYDEIIEICIILFVFNRETGVVSQIIEEYVGLREPACGIRPGAARVNGITVADVQGRDLDYAKVSAILEQAEFLIAHNASFDRGFLVRLFPQVAIKSWFCSMSGINWRGKGFPNRRLQDLLSCHDIRPGRAHRARDDVRATLELLSFSQEWGATYLSELLIGRRMKANKRR
ncbi:MAG TPA: exonuclease domain-containing protein [Syntrophomonadaceae bacterium]|nr:exonuclease domain-containing protein [Syntrophomonadaceae bacterium]